MAEIASRDDLKKAAEREIPIYLQSKLSSLPPRRGVLLTELADNAKRQILTYVERMRVGEKDIDLQFWREQEIEPNEALDIVEGAMDATLGCFHAYVPADVLPYERLRSLVEKKRTKREPSLDQDRPQVRFGLVVHGLQLIDPNNLIFELQGEASVGLHLEHAVQYLKVQDLGAKGCEAIGADLSLDGLLFFRAADNEKKLKSLLQVRMRGGQLDLSYSYFRYGIASGVVWLIQEFTARIYLRADFEHMPFDEFDVLADFNVGMGGDVVNVGLVVDQDLRTLFSEDFDAGEFKAAKETATLVSIGYLHDTSHFVDNVVRLSLRVWREPGKMLRRIGLPLLTIVSVMLVASWAAKPSDAASTVSGLLLSIVGLQLTAAQGMPRDAKFSVMDRCFVSSYLLAALLFVLLLSWPQSSLRVAVMISGILYILGLSAVLGPAWWTWWRRGPGAGASPEMPPPRAATRGA